MPIRRLFKQRMRWRPLTLPAVLAILAALGLASLRHLEQTYAQAGLWLFVGLTLTSGFFHGALDIVLIQREFAGPRRMAIALIFYIAAAVLLAMLCAYSGWLMLLILLLMSIWHFGEPYGRWTQTAWSQGAWVHRVIAGGAPVLLPALLSAQALQDVLPTAVGPDAEWAWTIWQTLAWFWVGLCALGLAVMRQRILSRPLWTEVVIAFMLNLLLSPLMAFSIYFGILHSTMHIARIATRYRRDKASDQANVNQQAIGPRIGAAIVVTSLATMALLLALAWYLKNMPFAIAGHDHLLNLLLVALTALTLPHLVLVSRSAHWLTARPSANQSMV